MFSFSRSRAFSLTAGPAVPSAEGTNPNTTAPSETYPETAASILTDRAFILKADSPDGPRTKGHLIAYYATDLNGANPRTLSTLAVTVYWRDGRSGRWFKHADVTLTHGQSEIIESPSHTIFIAAVTAGIGGSGLADTDIVTLYAGSW